MVDGVPPTNPHPDGTRVLVANEPRAYREVTVEVLGQLRPGVEFLLVEPAGIDDGVCRLQPDMVLCDEATPVVRDVVPAWLELYPHGNTVSMFGAGAERSAIENIQLADILALVDRVAEYKKA